MKIQTILATFLLVLHAANSQTAEDPDITFRGTWGTAPYTSQLGRVITKYTFKDNGECAVSIQFLDAKIGEVNEAGFCVFKDGELTIKNRNGVFVNTYTFSNGVLTIIEKNGNTYKLEREL